MCKDSIRLQLKALISEGKKKFIICPFGKIGQQVKQVLNEEFGIDEICIIDDLKYDNTSIFSMEYFLNEFSLTGDECVIIATTEVPICNQKVIQLKKIMEESNIRPLYENVTDFGYRHFFFEKRGFSFEEKVFKLRQDDTIFYLPYWDTDLIQSSIIIRDGYYEEETLYYIWNKYKDKIKEKTLLDIGANIGNHSIFFSKYCLPAKVCSFEPVKPTFKILERNVSINHLENNIEIYNCAVGDKNYKATYDTYDLNNIGGTSLYEQEDGDIDIITIDELNYQDVGFIKIDVEGFEEKVIRGALNTIKKYHPVMLIEIWEDSKNYEIIYDLLVNELGYKVYAYNTDNYIFE